MQVLYAFRRCVSSRKNSSIFLYNTRAFLTALLLFSTSAFAAVENGQEIGTPQMMESFAKGCFGAVMSPDGKRFYILRDGQLTQYQFNPLKKLGAIAVEPEQVRALKYAGPCKVGLTRNELKIIFVNRIDISLIDAKTGDLLKNVSPVELEKDYPESENYPAIYDRMAFNGDDLVIMLGTRLNVLDVNTLTYKIKDIDIGKKCGFDNHELKSMQNINNRLYFISLRSVVMLNGKTYECELSAKINEVFGGEHKLSRDFRTLALKGVTEVRDYQRPSHVRYEDMKKDDVLLFDLDTRTASVKKDKDSFKGISIYHLRSLIQADGHSIFSIREQGNRMQYSVKTGIVDERLEKFFVITTYEAGEAILMEAFLGHKFGNFQMTPGARKYLTMKNGEGKVVPMNDATFAKYHRTENLP